MPKPINKENVKQFWNWFDENKSHYSDYEDDWDPGMALLTQKLAEIDDELNAEIISEVDGLSEIIITANGDIEIFPAVKEVVNNAPEIRGWKVTAFKQPLGPNFIIRNAFFEINPMDMFFAPFMEEGALTIVIYGKDLKGLIGDDSIYYGLDILMNIIGEYDVATKIGLCYLEDLEEADTEIIIPLPKIKEYVDSIYYSSN